MGFVMMKKYDEGIEKILSFEMNDFSNAMDGHSSLQSLCVLGEEAVTDTFFCVACWTQKFSCCCWRFLFLSIVPQKCFRLILILYNNIVLNLWSFPFPKDPTTCVAVDGRWDSHKDE